MTDYSSFSSEDIRRFAADTETLDEGSEANLRFRIERWLRRHKIMFLCGVVSVPRYIRGLPDLIIPLCNGRMVWMELKYKEGFLSWSQQEIREYLISIGHEYHIVRSFADFLKIIGGHDA